MDGLRRIITVDSEVKESKAMRYNSSFILLTAFIFCLAVTAPLKAQTQREIWDQMPTYVPPSPTKEPPPSRAPIADHTTLEFFNKTSANVRVCVNYYDNRRRERVNEGWWEIKAYSSIRITLFTTDPQLAYYAYTILGRKWDARLGAPDAYPTEVVMENFIAREGFHPRSYSETRVVMKRVNAIGRQHTAILGP